MFVYDMGLRLRKATKSIPYIKRELSIAISDIQLKMLYCVRFFYA